ncbi:hypothetical protein Lal_00012469 [Lupinus albus]|nr:hypothetical protein Lal_00012469 [Lupinus albus]
MFVFYVRVVLVVVLVLFLAILPGYASRNPDLLSPAVVINLPSRTLELYSGNVLVKTYPVAIGKFSTPTPVGSFSIYNKEVDPGWYPPKGGPVVPSGPDNPLGYRWMEFLPMYGIHGTNAPWAIGEVVSNGCVRMQEEDVEELFEIIPYGTPVTITYDRVKVRVDESQVSIGIYPDVYDRGSISAEEVKQRLAAHNLQGIVDDAYIRLLIEEEADQQVTIAHKVNDKTLAEHAIIQDDTSYIPVWAIANLVKTQSVRAGSHEVPGTVKGNVIYVSAQNLQQLFGGQVLVKAEDKVTCTHNKVIAGEARMAGEVVAVPVLTVADSLGYKYIWDGANKTLLVQNKPIPIVMLDNQPYLPITQLLVHRAFYALPLLSTASGQYTNAVYGFTTMLLKLIEDVKPDSIAVAFDKGRITFRNEQYKEYKAQRNRPPKSYRSSITVLEKTGFEGDDIIGTLAVQAEKRGCEVIIVTGDRDALQLITNQTKVLLTKKGISEMDLMDAAAVEAKYGVTPAQIIDLKGLMGDTSDNIPGVPGVGEKTATKLIGEFGSMEILLANLDKVSGKKLQENLRNNVDSAIISKKLATIQCDVPLDDLPDSFIMQPQVDKLYELFTQLEFKSLAARIVSIFSEGPAELTE